MPSINKVILIGNLTRDPEIRYAPKGTAVTDIGMAMNRVTKDAEGNKREDVTFVDVTLWGRQAELADQYLSKGRSVYIEGRLQLDTWEDKESGQKRSRLKVVGEVMQFLGGGQQGEGQRKSAPATSPKPEPKNMAIPSNRAFAQEVDEDGIPF